MLLNEITNVTTLKKGISTEEVLRQNVCSMNNKECMKGKCDKCKGQSVYSVTKNISEHVKKQPWCRKSEKRTVGTAKEPTEKLITFTIKEEVNGTVESLLKVFETQLAKQKVHTYNLRAQFRYFKKKQESLAKNECMIHIDYPESYNCRLNTEVQSIHFGASKKQLTLHTGVYYVGNDRVGKTFDTVSDSMDHGPSAEWAHLKPFLTEIRHNHKTVYSVEFFSDGPVGQYKQKANFFLITKEPFAYGFKNVRWSYFQSGHGKGIPDAIGGTLKWEANRKVQYGKDITCAKDLVEQLKDC